MLETLAKCTVIVFGLFFIVVSFIMLFAPHKARATLRKAGSTNLINYSEISIRMIPAAALILAADCSRFPEVFRVFGWFMLGTSLVLFFVPRQLHHSFSLKAADVLKPLYFQFISPFALIIGLALIYSVC